MPLSGVLLAVDYQHPLPLALAVHPLAFEFAAVAGHEPSVTVLLVVGVPPFIGGAIGPVIDTESMFLAVLKAAFVCLSIFVLHFSAG
jgi:hypothetical protein